MPKLYTTDIQFELLHELHDKARGKQVKVPKQALINLLMDHGALCGKVAAGQKLNKEDGSDLV